jgi:hypothetical protein
MIPSFIKNLIPGTRTGAKSTESLTPSEESPKSGLSKEVTLVVRFYKDDDVIMDVVDVFYSNEKARQKATELKKSSSKDHIYGVITYPVVDANG